MTAKQKRFITRYLVTLNATKAAIEAGYSERSAQSQGSKLLATPEIRQRIDEAAEEKSAEAKIEAIAVLHELHTLLDSSVDDFEFDESGRLRVRPGVPASAIKAVRSVRHRREYDFDGHLRLETTEITLWDKPKSLTLAMKHLGLLIEKIEVQQSGQVTVYIPDNGRSRPSDTPTPAQTGSKRDDVRH